MPEQQIPHAVGPRLFTSKAVGFAAAFGGPLGGTILFALNFRRMGRSDAAKVSLAIGLLTWCALVAVFAFLPERIVDAVPNSTIPILLGVFGGLLVERHQGETIKAHLESGGRKGSLFSIFGAVLIGVAPVLPFILTSASESSFEAGTVSAMEDVATLQDVSALDYVTIGPSASVVYYDGTATDEQAALVGRMLEIVGYIGAKERSEAILTGDANGYTVVLGVARQHWDDPGVAFWFEALIIDLEQHFSAPVSVTARSFERGRQEDRVFGKREGASGMPRI